MTATAGGKAARDRGAGAQNRLAVAGKRSVIKALAAGAEKEALQAVEQTKASVRVFVEHPLHIVKNIFRHRQVRYRGLAKNGHPLDRLFGLANVVIGARRVAV